MFRTVAEITPFGNAMLSTWAVFGQLLLRAPWGKEREASAFLPSGIHYVLGYVFPTFRDSFVLLLHATQLS